jgi:alpha-beta hydrolase superfamily lysophospholipase
MPLRAHRTQPHLAHDGQHDSDSAAPATAAPVVQDLPEHFYVPQEGFGTEAQCRAAVAALDAYLAELPAPLPQAAGGATSGPLKVADPGSFAHPAFACGSLLQKVALRRQAQRGRALGPQASLFGIRHLCEAHWRRLVIPEFIVQRLFNAQLFAAWKVIDLLRNGRTPLEVSEGFVRATGAVGAVALEDRDIFYTRLAPRPVAHGGLHVSGVAVVLIPGLGETGRSVWAQAEALSAEGHEVVAMDPMWAGQSRNIEGYAGTGTLDRGLGLARDIHCVVHHVKTRLLPHAQIVLVGQGSGAAGVLMLQVSWANRLLPPVVPRCDAVLQAPYLGPTPTFRHRLLQLLMQIPWVGRLSAYPFLPAVTACKEGRQAYAAGVARDAVPLQLAAFARLQSDVDMALQQLQRGALPAARFIILHSADDPWANPAQSHHLGRPFVLGRQALVRIGRGADHALSLLPAQRAETVWAVRRLSH